MNNKGFTLVELLAVILILLGLAGITMFGITNVLENQDQKNAEQQKELACGAAKIYFSLHEGESTVTVSKLKSEGHFSSVSKTDKLEDTDVIKINSSKIICYLNYNCDELEQNCPY